MKEIQLTKGFVALVDDEDFEWINSIKWHASTNKGSRHVAKASIWIWHLKGYIGASMHRIILGVYDKNIQVDHIDGNPLNNQKNNLRTCSNSENNMNRPSRKGAMSKSKYKGVSRVGKKWGASITANGSQKWLGTFENEHDAAEAYNLAAKTLHKEFANINSI